MPGFITNYDTVAFTTRCPRCGNTSDTVSIRCGDDHAMVIEIMYSDRDSAYSSPPGIIRHEDPGLWASLLHCGHDREGATQVMVVNFWSS